MGETLWVLAIGTAVYFFPVFVAWGRDHPSRSGIGILNLFLGWTFVGWVVALVWAVSGPKVDPNRPPDVRTRTCPFCFGEIDARATVCRHCRKSLVKDDDDEDEGPRVYEIK